MAVARIIERMRMHNNLSVYQVFVVKERYAAVIPNEEY
jgi:hypothetical protein